MMVQRYHIGLPLAVPKGVILLHNSVTIPHGWTRLSAYDGRFIRGAGGTYSPLVVGGAVNWAANSGSNGAHAPGTYTFPDCTGSVSCDALQTLSQDDGTHLHVCSGTYYPLYRQIILIQADHAHQVVPANSVVLGNSTTSPHHLMSRVYSELRAIYCGSSITTGGGSLGSLSHAVGGSHSHPSTCGTAFVGGWTYNRYIASGHHGPDVHAMTGWTATDNFIRRWLTGWSNSTIGLPPTKGMILMYNGATAPEGYYLCDGNNGTPDMRDYYLYFTSGSPTSATGTTITITGSLDYYNAAHNHRHTDCNNIVYDSEHHGYSSWNHNHAGPGSATYTPPFVALTFIQKI